MNDTATFRQQLGLIAVVGSLLAFGLLFFVTIPAQNENALMFAMGVIFGWGSAVFASEYGSSSTARKVTEGAIRQMEHQAAAPAGTKADPTHTEVVNVPDNPVPTTAEIKLPEEPKPKGKGGA